MTREEMKQQIEQLVRERDHVTYVELQILLGEESCGNLRVDRPKNVVWWIGMSEMFCDAVMELRKEQRIYPAPASLLAYMIDGYALKFPVLKRAPRKPLKNPRWIPIVWRPGKAP
jgi:hypothetical protein